jgi:nicotinate phosphoribosyltransferase
MIINSLLDNDLYKFVMMQLVWDKYPYTRVEYEFKSRGNEDLGNIKDLVEQELQHWANLSFTNDEIHYLKSLSYFKPEFIEYLRIMDITRPRVTLCRHGKDLSITITGRWLESILYEVPVLAIINELYYRNCKNKDGFGKLHDKIEQCKLDGFKFMEFGTRRRFSTKWQRTVVSLLKKHVPDNLLGTSNVLLAKDLQLTPLGTQGHEYFMAFQALTHPRESQSKAIQVWLSEYPNNFGILLTDTIGIDAFLQDFHYGFARVFKGVRHDSGDPVEFANKVIRHYKDYDIDPKTKTIVFSDGLTMSKAIDLHYQFGSQINTMFGIGTSMTNDVGYTPLSIVMKMTRCNGLPVAKISDSPGKTMCKSEACVQYLREIFHVD